MKYTLLVIFIVLCTGVCRAQKKPKILRHTDGYVSYPDTGVNKNYCLLLVEQEGKQPIKCFDVVGLKGNYISQKLYKPMSEAKKIYGNNCVSLITLKPKLEVITLDKLLQLYNIPQSDRHLTIFIDKVQSFTQSRAVVVIKSAIVSVKVVTKDKMRLINITTTSPYVVQGPKVGG